MSELTGNSITVLAEITDIQQYKDLFLISEHDKFIYDVFESRKLSAKTLIDSILENNILVNSLGDMAYQLSDDYSPKNHNHNSEYNKLTVQYYPNYPTRPVKQDLDFTYEFDGYPIRTCKNDSYLSVGNIFFDGVLSTFYIPLSCVKDVTIIPEGIVAPEVGQLKFVAVNEISSNSDIDIHSEYFDGWVYPNGNTLTCKADEFKKACAMYGSGEAATSFTLPDFRSFVKMSVNQTNPIEFSRYSNGGCEHNHPAHLKATGEITAYGYLDVSKLAGNGGWLHNGDGQTTKNEIQKTPPMSITGHCELQVTGITVSGCDRPPVDRETHPNHQYLPVMVYIGKAK